MNFFIALFDAYVLYFNAFFNKKILIKRSELISGINNFKNSIDFWDEFIIV